MLPFSCRTLVRKAPNASVIASIPIWHPHWKNFPEATRPMWADNLGISET
jgi:hypothetical protein